MIVEPASTRAEERLRRAFEMHRLGMSLRASGRVGLPPEVVFGPLLHALLRAWRPLEDDWDTARWTDGVIDALLSARPLFARLAGLRDDEVSPFHHQRGRRERSREIGFDFVWGTWPAEAVLDPSIAPSRPWEILLAAESEWGALRSRRENLRRVLFDLRKLLDVRARYKLLVYGAHDRARGVVDIDEHLRALIASSAHARDDASRFLLVSVPWDTGLAKVRAWTLRCRGGEYVRVDLPVPAPR